MVSALDSAVGEVLEEVSGLGVADHTIVVFTSDASDHYGHPTGLFQVTSSDKVSFLFFFLKTLEQPVTKFTLAILVGACN